MKSHILKGSKQEIVERLARMSGEVREVIVFEEETFPTMAADAVQFSNNIFSEMVPFMVEVPAVDDSRESVYTGSIH